MGRPFCKLIFILFFFTFSMPASAQPATIPPIVDGFKLTPVIRTSFIVRDLEESLKLYRDILGLRPWFEGVLEGEALDTLVGNQGRSLRNVILQSGNVVVGNIGLFQYLDDKTPAPEIIPELRTGDVAVIFYTNDISGIHDAVEAAGYTIIARPVALYPKEGQPTQNVEMIFFDADGIGINLIQRDVPIEELNE